MSNETHVINYRFVRNNVGAWVGLGNENVESKTAKGGCQEIGLVTIMFFFKILFSYMLLSISFYVFLSLFLFSLIPTLI